jgi:glycosyltransferase involved in cell wall biosynthesis
MTNEKSILFVQHGDFEEAYRLFAAGGEESYRDQKASVDFVTRLAYDARVTTFAFGSRTYHTNLAPGLWAAGGSREKLSATQVSRLFDETEATHLVLRTPHLAVLQEAARRGLHVLPSFADIFSPQGLRGRYRNWKLRHALQQSKAPCYSNHSLNASRSLVRALGLPRARVVPWDWTKVPLVGEAKSGIANPNLPTAFFAGALSEDKGVGDCLEAISLLRAEGIVLLMSFAGPGELPAWQTRAERLGIAAQVKFLGTVSNPQVRAEMHQHDFVIVPSRHSYAEGLPNTIYEGLASRSVLIVSDHPAFAGRLLPDVECLIFPAANPQALATSLKRAISDPELYRRVSENAPQAHDQLYIGMEWTALVTAFLDDPSDSKGWVDAYSLKNFDFLSE